MEVKVGEGSIKCHKRITRDDIETWETEKRLCGEKTNILAELCQDVLLYMMEWLNIVDLGALSNTGRTMNSLVAETHVFKIYKLKGQIPIYTKSPPRMWEIAIKHRDDWIYHRCQIIRCVDYSKDEFHEYCEIVCKYGTVSQFEWMPKILVSSSNYFLDIACQWSNLEVAKSMASMLGKKGKPNYAKKLFSISLDACCRGNLEIAQWLYESYNVIPYDSVTFKYIIRRIRQYSYEHSYGYCGDFGDERIFCSSYYYNVEGVESVISWLHSLSHLCKCSKCQNGSSCDPRYY